MPWGRLPRDDGAVAYRGTTRRIWLMPILVLACVALAVFVGFYALDHFFTGGERTGTGLLGRYFLFDPQMITDAIPALAGMIAAVLGIVITVVSIIVQLSADRYTGVAQMFLRDRTNIGVMAYFVIACVGGVWLSLSLHQDFVPRAAVVALIVATTFGLVLMLPYFAYVFWFLEPANIIARIRQDAVGTIAAGTHTSSPERIAALQAPTIAAMEELSDITSNSISGKDKIIASRAVDALKDFALEYVEVKGKARAEWFEVGPGIRDNPDFVAMDPESLRDLATRRTWVEWKVLRQYLGIYNEAMSGMPDINYLIAIDTRYIGEAAIAAGDDELLALTFRFMNSYLRATLNARAVRTAYNVLNQYRLLVERVIGEGKNDVALEAVKFMNYYGHVSFDMQLFFVSETVAYDIASLCEHAYRKSAGLDDRLLGMFLELDQPMTIKKQMQGLVGIRKAQVKLAAYYLSVGQQAKAKRIVDDMRDEPPVRLALIRDQLAKVETKDFWEIIDRGRNFEYMPPTQRKCLATFFEMVGVGETPAAEFPSES